MNRMIRKMIRPFWRMSGPIRRPLVSRFDEHVLGLLRQSQPPMPPGPPADLDLVLNSVVRELARLRAQVETLQSQMDSLESSDRDHDNECDACRLSVVADIG